MKYMDLSIASIAVLVCSISCSAKAGDKVGGGDPGASAFEFRAIARNLLHRFQVMGQATTAPFDLKTFASVIDWQSTDIVAKPVACRMRLAPGQPCPADEVRAAVNFPSDDLSVAKHRIEVSDPDWTSISGKSKLKEGRVLHEFFGLLRLERDADTFSANALDALRNFESNMSSTPASVPAYQGATTEIPWIGPGFECYVNAWKTEPTALGRLHDAVKGTFKKVSDSLEKSCRWAMDACQSALHDGTISADSCARQTHLGIQEEFQQCTSQCDLNVNDEIGGCLRMRHDNERKRCEIESGIGTRQSQCYRKCDHDPRWLLNAKPVMPFNPHPELPALHGNCEKLENADLSGVPLNTPISTKSPEFTKIKRYLLWADCNNGAPVEYEKYEFAEDDFEAPHTTYVSPGGWVPFHSIEAGDDSPIGENLTSKLIETDGFAKVLSPNQIVIYVKWERHRNHGTNERPKYARSGTEEYDRFFYNLDHPAPNQLRIRLLQINKGYRAPILLGPLYSDSLGREQVVAIKGQVDPNFIKLLQSSKSSRKMRLEQAFKEARSMMKN